MATSRRSNARPRAGTDYVGALTRLLVAASWVVVLAIVWTLSEAAPETTWGIESFFETSRRNPTWNLDLVDLARSLTLALMMVTLTGLGIQTTEESGPRSYSKSLIALACTSVAGLVAFFALA